MNNVNLLLLAIPVLLASCAPDKSNSANTTRAADSSANTEASFPAVLDSTNKAHDNATIMSQWEVSTFVDEYGEGTKDKYIHTNITGTFSNSATSNAYLFVTVLLKKDGAGIFLHEYDKNAQAEKIIGTARIKMKNSEEKEIEILTSSVWNQSGGISIHNASSYDGNDFSKFKRFIKKSKGEIKVIIYDEYSSSYRFNIDTNGFEKELQNAGL